MFLVLPIEWDFHEDIEDLKVAISEAMTNATTAPDDGEEGEVTIDLGFIQID